MKHTGEQAFETVIEAHLLANGYVSVAGDGFDRERAIFPETVLAFVRETQPKEWAKLETLHGDRTGEQIVGEAPLTHVRTSGCPDARVAMTSLTR